MLPGQFPGSSRRSCRRRDTAEWPSRTVSCPSSRLASQRRNCTVFATTPRWVATAAFDRPVVPPEYWKRAVSSACDHWQAHGRLPSVLQYFLQTQVDHGANRRRAWRLPLTARTYAASIARRVRRCYQEALDAVQDVRATSQRRIQVLIHDQDADARVAKLIRVLRRRAQRIEGDHHATGFQNPIEGRAQMEGCLASRFRRDRPCVHPDGTVRRARADAAPSTCRVAPDLVAEDRAGVVRVLCRAGGEEGMDRVGRIVERAWHVGIVVREPGTRTRNWSRHGRPSSDHDAPAASSFKSWMAGASRITAKIASSRSGRAASNHSMLGSVSLNQLDCRLTKALVCFCMSSLASRTSISPRITWAHCAYPIAENAGRLDEYPLSSSRRVSSISPPCSIESIRASILA